jgi:hypothetical protein
MAFDPARTLPSIEREVNLMRRAMLCLAGALTVTLLAIQAVPSLETGDVTVVLSFVPAVGEPEVREAFHQVVQARQASTTCREVADRDFFETVVRIHRAGEGAPFTGLKPAGLDVEPAIPAAEKAIERGDVAPLEDLLVTAIREELGRRIHHLGHLRDAADQGLDEARAYVQAMLGLQVWAHGLYQAIQTSHAPGHGHD